jgi:hypothetical protein
MGAFHQHFDTWLSLNRNDCATYANGLIQHLTGVPNAHVLLQEDEQCFDGDDASGLDAASW